MCSLEARSRRGGADKVSTRLHMQAYVLDNQLEWTSTHEYAETHELAMLIGLAVEEATRVHAANPCEFIASYLLSQIPTRS